MKLLILAQMALISLILSISATAYTSDSLWIDTATSDTNIVEADTQLLADAFNATDIPAIQKYCELTKSDVKLALQKSHSSIVSSKWMDAKIDYEIGLSHIMSGTQKLCDMVTVMNETILTDARKDLMKGTEYLKLMKRDIALALAQRTP